MSAPNYLMSALFWILLASVPLGVSIVYLLFAPQHQPLLMRWATCAHGASLSALWMAAVFISFFSVNAQWNWSIFGPLCLLPAALMLYSLWKYAGTGWLHLLQLINTIWLLAFVVIGHMPAAGV